jgi:hypothetical protein
MISVMFRTKFVVIFQVEVLWIVTLCIVVAGYQRFRCPCCLSFHPEHGGSIDL